jgi:putative FmdB family regulatory protein
MPIYEYQCSICGHKFEELQNITDQPLTNCPNCNKPMLNKLISAVGFQLKGTGWYKTDYSTKGKPPADQVKSEDITKQGTNSEGEKKVSVTKPVATSSSKPADSGSKEEKKST